jgi:hypothetical protein
MKRTLLSWSPGLVAAFAVVGGAVGCDESEPSSAASGGSAATAAPSTEAGSTFGSSGTGSTPAAGSGSGASRVVEPCPTGDSAPSMIGVWENITPAGLVSLHKGTPGGAIVVNPKDTRVVYAGSADGGGLFKSSDCGATFAKVNTGQHGDDLDFNRMWDIVVDPVDPETVYAVGAYGHNGLWKTSNGGVDWLNATPDDGEVGQTATGNFASIVGMDVTNHLHLVIQFHSGCGGAYAPNCQAETTDGGTTWKLLKVPGGGEGVGVAVLDGTTWLTGSDLTTDGGATWKSVSDTAVHWQLYRSTTGMFYVGTLHGILRSKDGKSWELLPGFSHSVQGISGDGTNIFAGSQWGSPFYKIPEQDPGAFTELPATDGNDDGSYFMTYDPDHHLLYASEFQSGHWRLRLE